jgi:hypothetical protein
MIKFVIFLIVVSVFSACSIKQESISYKIDDLSRYPQSFDAYTKTYKESNTTDKTDEFEKQFFSPWHYTKAPYSLENILWPYRSYTKGVIFGATLKPLHVSWFDDMKRESNFDSFDTLHRYALTKEFVSLRNFPTDKPLFRDPNKAGEGFPFDYNQNSGIHAGEPLYLSHYTLKGDWVYVFTSYASGWLHVKDIQEISNRHKKLWEHSKHIYITKDYQPLYDDKKEYLLDARIGMLLPLVSEDEKSYKILTVEDFKVASISKDAASLDTLKLDSKNLNKIGDELIAQDYGWGGLYRDRDCSSMLKDFFTVFGIWLPRNSSQQSKVGKVFSLKDLDADAKKILIKKEAIPFETLFYKSGHIMLYLGIYDGKIMIFHNTWGIKTINMGEEGRNIVGESVISTLYIGKELYNYDYNSNLIDKLKSFNIITLRP